MTTRQQALNRLRHLLADHDVTLSVSGDRLLFASGDKQVSYTFADENSEAGKPQDMPVIPLDYLVTAPEKIVGMLLSRLGLNRVVYARNCQIAKISREEAASFINRYHIMNATGSGFNLGLFHNGELLAVASFSKGRRMNRLNDNQRSYELIRYCCKAGISVSGGLSRLLRFFVRDKQPGDVMTYVDRQWSGGPAFVKIGFTIVEQTPPRLFLVDRESFVRVSCKQDAPSYDQSRYYLAQSPGNLKMIYTPDDGQL